MAPESEDLASALRARLLTPEQAGAMQAHGRTEAAVLVPMFGLNQRPGLILTERRADLRRHAGEISFPGGRRDLGEELLETALREAEEEVALDPDRVEIVGALPPIGTFVTNYTVHPFVGLVSPGAELRPNPAEVAAILHLHLDALREGYEMRRLVRRGVPFRTPTYEVERHLVWGATARILEELFERIDEA